MASVVGMELGVVNYRIVGKVIISFFRKNQNKCRKATFVFFDCDFVGRETQSIHDIFETSFDVHHNTGGEQAD